MCQFRKMNKHDLENKTGVTILDTPVVYQDEDETKINVKLPCEHTKLIAIKSLVKKTPKCTICNPRKARVKEEFDAANAMKIMMEEINASNQHFKVLLLQRLLEENVQKSVKIFSAVHREFNLK